MFRIFKIAVVVLLLKANIAMAVNVAVIAPKDENLFYFGRDLAEGVRIAVDLINENGGVLGEKINLIEIEDRCNDLSAVSTAQMLSSASSEKEKLSLVIGSYCQNMFDKNAVTQERYIDTTGAIVYNGGHYDVSDYIAVVPGENYTITNVRPGNTFGSGVHYYDSNKVWQRYHSCNGTKCYARPQTDEVYIRFNLVSTQRDVIQMEPGTVATPYRPYGENTFIPQNVQ